MSKYVKLMLVVTLLLPMFTQNQVEVSAKRYSSGYSSLARSRNNSSLNSLNKKNNYTYKSSTNNNYTRSNSRRLMRTGGGILSFLLIGNLLFGSSPILSLLTTMLFWMFIISILSKLFRGKRQTTYQQTNYGYNNQQGNSHHMQQMAIINELVNEANQRDIDVSFILDDDNTTLDEKISLIRQQLNKI